MGRPHLAAESASHRRQGPHLQERPSESGNRPAGLFRSADGRRSESPGPSRRTIVNGRERTPIAAVRSARVRCPSRPVAILVLPSQGLLEVAASSTPSPCGSGWLCPRTPARTSPDERLERCQGYRNPPRSGNLWVGQAPLWPDPDRICSRPPGGQHAHVQGRILRGQPVINVDLIDVDDRLPTKYPTLYVRMLSSWGSRADAVRVGPQWGLAHPQVSRPRRVSIPLTPLQSLIRRRACGGARAKPA